MEPYMVVCVELLETLMSLDRGSFMRHHLDDYLNCDDSVQFAFIGS